MNETSLISILKTLGYGSASFADLRGSASGRPLTTSEQIADALCEDIAHGKFPPGSALREQAMALRFEISRGPIRDAYRLLERDGLITVLPNRGAVVTDHSLDEMEEIARLSHPIAHAVWRRTLDRLSPEGRAALLACQRRIAQLTEHPDALVFALAVASLTIHLSEFSSGFHTSRLVQQLYRPTIRLTVLGLNSDAARAAARNDWLHVATHCEANQGGAAADAFLRMLRAIQRPVLDATVAQKQAQIADTKILSIQSGHTPAK